MRKIVVTLIDDIDGSEAARNVQFSLDGKSYSIDLSESNIEKLEQALEPFIEKAQKVTRSRGGGGSRGGGRPATKTALVREWAREQGHDVPARGRVPNDLIELYDAAH